MISFPHLLMNRELGLPGAQLKLMDVLNQQTVSDLELASNLVDDCFDCEIIELPNNFSHRTFAQHDFVAILSVSKIDKKILRLALWSLLTRSKLWDVEISSNYHQSSEPKYDSCKVSKCGLVLVDLQSMRQLIPVFKGQQLGMLQTPKHGWLSIHSIGKRILGCWMDSNYDLKHNEWNQKGDLLRCYHLGKELGIYSFACNENFWVRTNSHNDKLNINVINQTTGALNTFEIPHCEIPPSEIPPSEIPPSLMIGVIFYTTIVNNLLFYGKCFVGYQGIEVYSKPTITIFDLENGNIVAEFPTEAKDKLPTKLVANQYHVAWIESKKESDFSVKYLNIFSKTIKKIRFHSVKRFHSAHLNINGSVLSIIYAKDEHWHRTMIDMTTDKLRYEVKYKQSLNDNFLMSNGNILIENISNGQHSLYIESFTGQGCSKENSTFRV